MSEEPQVTYLTDAQAAEFTRRRETLSLECSAATPRCAGCDGAAAEGWGPCLHDCHDDVEPHDAALTAMQDHNARMAFVMRVLTLFAMHPNDSTEMLMWRVDGKYAPITFLVSCSDFFWWGTADCEIVTPDEIEALEQAFADVKAASTNTQLDAYWGAVLYVARKRRMRPQGAAYPTVPALAALFDACGPERAVGLGNPKQPPVQDGAAT